MKKWQYFILILVGIIFCIFFYQNPYKISENFTLLKPSFQHILGTDNLGRDIFSRLLLGTFYSIFLAFPDCLRILPIVRAGRRFCGRGRCRGISVIIKNIIKTLLNNSCGSIR